MLVPVFNHLRSLVVQLNLKGGDANENKKAEHQNMENYYYTANLFQLILDDESLMNASGVFSILEFTRVLAVKRHRGLPN